jgi:hypothetical protein
VTWAAPAASVARPTRRWVRSWTAIAVGSRRRRRRRAGHRQHDRVVGDHLGQIDPARGHQAAPHRAAVADRRIVGAGRGQAIDEADLELLAAQGLAQLARARRVGEDLHGLDPGQIVEEPAAARVHRHGVATELHELEGADPAGSGQRPAAVAGQEPILDRGIGAGQDHLDVGVARGPRIDEQLGPERVVEVGDAIAQPVERVAQRPTPGLAPPGPTAGVAAAVGAPPIDPVGAAPRRVLADLDLPGGRPRGAERGVVGERRAGVIAAGDRRQRPGQAHIAVAVVVAVGLAVGRDVAQRRVVATGRDQATREGATVDQQALERHRSRQRSVVEEHVDGATRRQRTAVDPARGRGVDRAPGPSRRADPGRLMWRQHRERHALGGQVLEGGDVDRALRQPHPDRIATEVVAKVGHAPAHLGRAIARRAQRHDEVTVGLGQRRAVTGGGEAGAIGGLQRRQDVRRVARQVGQERGPEVPAHARVVVDDLDDLAFAVDDPRRGVGPIALGGDPRVPVGERRRGRLRIDLVEPRVLARRLIEVTVDADVAGHDAPSGSATRKTQPSGGSVSVTDAGHPSHGTATASTAPRLPTPLPP